MAARTSGAAQTSGWVLFFKWLVVPLALAALGYFLLGPRLGSTPIPKIFGSSGLLHPPATEPAARDTPKPESNSSISKEPTVKVDVRPAVDGTVPVATVHHRRRRHRSTTTATLPSSREKPPGNEAQPAPDQGGSGGATTAGNGPPN